MYIIYFVRALHLNKHEFHSPKNALCQVWLIWAHCFWRRFLNFVNTVSLFSYYLPLEKDVVLHLSKGELPSPKYALNQVRLTLAQLFWRKNVKI